MKYSAVDEWQGRYFGEAYLEIYARLMYDRKKVLREVNFIQNALHLKKGSRILDLACGFGKHLIFFLKKGLCAFGLDIMHPYLRYAMGKMPVTFRRKPPLVIGTMTRLPFQEETFEAVVSLFNSFGYRPMDAPDPDMAILREVARVLRTGGQFLVEVPNKQPVIKMVRTTPQTIQCGRDFLIHEFWDYDTRRTILFNRTFFNIRGGITEAGYCLRLFTLRELTALFQNAGLGVRRIFGDYDGAKYDRAISPMMLVIGEKPGRQRVKALSHGKRQY
jgi:ubiquinone/menaquinone biosynthesis C-methylase UbiE